MKSERAFSLVEVTLSIGIVGFVLLSVLGLTATSWQQIQGAEADSTLASLAHQSLQTARLELVDGQDFAEPPAPWALAGPDSYRRELYFDKEGRPLGDVVMPDAYFRARLLLGPSPSAAANVTSESLKALRVTVEWPALAPADKVPNSHRFSLLLRNSGTP